jgi:hypothetical protein
MLKHEVIPCERCGTRVECKANSITKCQCSQVQLSLNETQYISENFDGCLCISCLLDLKNEYLDMIASGAVEANLNS